MGQAGKLIVMEGLDGSGKATQSKLLVEHLEKRSIPCRKISFPDYNSRSSVLAKMYLDGEIGSLDEIGAYAASSFYSVDRYVSYMTEWRQDYLGGKVVVADRYTTSNACHQMIKEPRERWDEFLSWLGDFEYAKMGLPRPALVLYLDMHPNTSRELLKKRYEATGAPDIHEQDLAYLLRCREGALYAAERLGWQIIRCCDGKTPYPPLEIAKKVSSLVDEYLSQNG